MHEHDRSKMEQIINDPASTAEEKAAAEAALDAQADPVAADDDTRAMLAALKVERIADLNEEMYERYCVAHCTKQSDPIVTESRYWITPSAEFLELIGLTLRGYWQAVDERATAAGSPDAQAHTRTKLQELGAS